jgi:hypothetical protein
MGAAAAVAGPKQRQWYRDRFPDHVYNARVSKIVAKGLPCVVHCNTSGGFVRLVRMPQNGWTHLCNDAALERRQSSGRRYHISACYADTLDPEAWFRTCSRWHGKFVHIGISHFSREAAALLAWAGLGSDADLWALYMNGCWGYKWHDTNYGLHISM